MDTGRDAIVRDDAGRDAAGRDAAGHNGAGRGSTGTVAPGRNGDEAPPTPSQPAAATAAELTPEAVARKTFAPARKGYNRAEVREFLQTVATALGEAGERISDLERRLARQAVKAGASGAAVESDDAGLLEAVSAEAWRDEVLADLERRRRELNAEVMRLRSGRDHLRDGMAAVMEVLAEQSQNLEGLLRAARTAGEREVERIRKESDRSAGERRAELEAARLAGFVTVGAQADNGPADGGPADSAPAEESSSSDQPRPAATPPSSSAAPRPAAAPSSSDEPRPAGEPSAAPADLFARLRAECEATGAGG